MKNKLKSIAVILIVLTIGLTSCSKQYNLALIKRNNNSENGVSQVKITKPIPVMEQKVIKTVIESNENLNIKTYSSNPVIATQNNNEIETSSIANDETGIDKSLYSNDSKLKSYYPEFEDKMTDKSHNKYDHSNEAFLLYIILAIFIPPLCVGLWEGGLTFDFWIDLLLTFCFWLPGVIFALIVIL